MADETLTGSQKEVTIDTTKVETRKKIIKWVVIAAVVVLAVWLIKKYVL